MGGNILDKAICVSHYMANSDSPELVPRAHPSEADPVRTIEATIVIDAPPAAVWDVLTAADDYRDWNPFICDVSGTFTVGERLRIRVRPVGRRAMTFRPRVTEKTPHARLRWVGRLGLPGICDAEHDFVLTELPDGTTQLTQRETFSGILVPLMTGTLASTRQGFEAMHEALARRVTGVQVKP